MEPKPAASPLVEISSLPSARTFGDLYGRDGFRAFCRNVYADDAVKFVQDDDGAIVVFRNHHLRELAVHPNAGNTPPNALARGAFAVIRDPRQSPAGKGAALVRTVASQVFSMNGELHDAARAILTAQLSPRAAARMSETAQLLIEQLLEDAVAAGEIDFHHQISERLAASFWGTFVGMTAKEIAETRQHVDAMSAIFLQRPTADEVRAFDIAVERYATLVSQAARRAEASEATGHIGEMAAQVGQLACFDDPDFVGVTPPDIGAFLAGNLIDAFHTAALGVTNAVLAAVTQPALFDLLRAEPQLIPRAATEALRLEPPVLSLSRYALGEIAFDGVRIPAGVRIMMCWAAGNFDPAAFARPYAFDMDRPQRGMSTFGSGAQICPGRLVAAMLISQTLKAIAARNIEITVDQKEVRWLDRSAMAQVQSMPVRIRRAA
jgi:cytochrome P450